MKRIVLGADDYGQAEAVSRGIIDLILADRLTATSALVNFEHWPAHARWLLPCREKALLGLHLNLTEGIPLSVSFKKQYGDRFPSLGALLLRASMRRLSQAAVADELAAQLAAFKSAMGFYPAYLDGHQHVHHFPIVRDALRQVYEAAGLKSLGVRVRSVHRHTHWTSLLQDPKASIIEWTGANALLNQWLIPERIPHNTSFEGIYAFSDSQQCRRYFQRFLANIQDGGMIMCHPGRSSQTGGDPIGLSRYDEYQYLASDEFLKDCQAASVVLSHFQS